MSKLKKASAIRFDEAFAAVESIDAILPSLEEALDEVRYRDFEAILRDPSLTPLQIYNKGFTALARLREELQQNLTHYNGKK